jgi:bacillithiol biosynthesis cysteine-adding enzyme BshC
MKKNFVSLESTHLFSQFFKDYIQEASQLKPFYAQYPNVENLHQQVRHKNFSQENRNILVQEIEQQYKSIEIDTACKNNIHKLGLYNTYTITTGHQLNLLTGPLYFIYKIASVVKIATQLKFTNPENNFVPVFWMASEDHDFQEINHFHLFSQKWEWQSQEKGAVGQFATSGIHELLKPIADIPDWVKNIYENAHNLADATRKIVHRLFPNSGIVVIDANCKALKSIFKPIMLSEVEQQTCFQKISESTQQLEQLGYQTQASARPINLFYLEKGIRARIELDETSQLYKVVGHDITFSLEQIKRAIQEHPEKFSPNVVLRPMYQETILPNLAYIGGPAEIIYWLQLKSSFEALHIPFPLLIPRIFALHINSNLKSKIEKLGLSNEDLFRAEEDLKKEIVLKNQISSFDCSQDKKAVEDIFQQLYSHAEEIDKTLLLFIEAEKSKALKILDEVEKKFTKALERKNDAPIKQLQNIKSKLFPQGEAQERHDNYFNIGIFQPHFISDLIETIEPFQFQYHILESND